MASLQTVTQLRVDDGSVVQVRNTFIELVYEDAVYPVRRRAMRFNTDSPQLLAKLPSCSFSSPQEDELEVVSTPLSPSECAAFFPTAEMDKPVSPCVTRFPCEELMSEVSTDASSSSVQASPREQCVMQLANGCQQVQQPHTVFCMPVLVPCTFSAQSSTQSSSSNSTTSSCSPRQTACIPEKASARTRLLGQVIRQQESAGNGSSFLIWCVDARKLRGNSKQIVSPAFEVSTGINGRSAPFKLTLYPKRFRSYKGGATFDASKGRGHIQLKCEGEITCEANFTLSIGSESSKKVTRGPFHHDFSQNAVAVLPKAQDEWDFFGAIDSKSETFMVTLEVVLP